MITPSISTSIQTDKEILLIQGKSATWEDYLSYRDAAIDKRVKLFFYQGYFWVDDMGWEGLNHANISGLFTMIIFIWSTLKPQQLFNSFCRCLLEKPETKAVSPDLVLYVGEDYPRWQEGEPRLIDLTKWRVPDLVGEISDTTLAIDLDEKKKLYADLKIPEYWVIDVRGQRVFAFQLQATGKYEQFSSSSVLEELPISLLEQTLERLQVGTNTNAAAWFAQQVSQLKID